MPRIEPIQESADPFFEDMRQKMIANMGFTANSFRTMAHWPEMAKAFAQLAQVVNFSKTDLPVDIKRLVSYAASYASGCQYCAAHTGFQATRSGGVPAEKIEALWNYEASPLYSDAERAAIRVAIGAAASPNAVTDADMDELKKHFSDRQIVEMVAQISVFGFLNRWNDTMATELEAPPIQYGKENLTASGWEVGKHVAD